jgi:hypothetical protein
MFGFMIDLFTKHCQKLKHYIRSIKQTKIQAERTTQGTILNTYIEQLQVEALDGTDNIENTDADDGVKFFSS